MTGLIWFVQVVHYPLLARAGPEGFAALAAEHQRRTGWVVGVPMVVEAVTAAALVVWTPDGVARGVAVAGLALVAVIWGSTWLLQVPRRQVYRWRGSGLTDRQADHLAIRCGLHPVLVWPGW